MQLREFVLGLKFFGRVVFNNVLLKDTTDRSKISSDRYRIQFDVNLYSLSFFTNTPFKSI